jgi:hypothetical protein
LKNITKRDLVDLVSVPNQVVKAKAEPNSSLNTLSGKQLNHAYCKAFGKKGLVWKAQKKWTEVCLLSEYLEGTVVIENAELLESSLTIDGSLPAAETSIRGPDLEE